MRVTFEFFGELTRLAGATELQLRLPPGSCTVAEALAALVREQPALGASLQRSACAIGDALVRRGDALPDGARLALLPPVAGG